MSDPRTATLTEIATWLLEEIDRRGGVLDEDTATIEIVRLFGADEGCDLSAENRFVPSDRLRAELDRVAATWPRELVVDRLGRTFRLRPRTPPYR